VTYDGSGQAVHPDVTRTPPGWRSGIWQFVATPYPDGNAFFENPSLYLPRTAFEWLAPEGVVNPIARPNGHGHLSDPDHLYNPDTKEQWLYYRKVSTHNDILLVRSSDGVRWSVPSTVVSVPNHLAISPSVVRRGPGDWMMWTVNGGTEGCGGERATVELRRSLNGIDWSTPQTIVIQASDRSPWHLDVRWIPERQEFWAIFNGKLPFGCTTDALFIATSPDGVSWTTYPTPVLERGAIPAFADVVYRGSLWYDEPTDMVTFWYSGAALSEMHYTWRLAIQSLPRTALFEQVAQPWDRASLRSRAVAVPLTNATAP
jgi:hypothetical protein